MRFDKTKLLTKTHLTMGC